MGVRGPGRSGGSLRGTGLRLQRSGRRGLDLRVRGAEPSVPSKRPESGAAPEFPREGALATHELLGARRSGLIR